MNDKIVKIWLKYANDDLKAGVLLFNNDPDEFKSIVCYHMEQAVEKYLKAYLIFNNKEINKTHDITELIENCKEIDIDFDNIYSFNANELTDYAVNMKYPSSSKVISLEDEKTAVSIANQVKSFVMEKIKNK